MAYSNAQPRLDTFFSLQGYQPLGNAGFPAPGVDFTGQARFGLGPGHVGVNSLPGVPPLLYPYGVAVPGIADALRPYNHLAGLPLHPALGLDKDAAALADGLDRLSLNPMAKEFVPPKGHPGGKGRYMNGGKGQQGKGGKGQPGKGQVKGQGKDRKQPPKKRRSQKGLEDNVRRTVYISYIDQSVTEEQLAKFFQECGTVVDCRICGDPNSSMKFAFIEFTEEEAAKRAQGKTGSVLGDSPLRVLPSKTAIVPVNKELMPHSNDELERCGRTVYAANIDKKVDKSDVKHFFEQLCGKVSKIRLLGDFAHSTRIAFIEFDEPEGAMAALNCSGALLGSLPLRVSPSKTPVRSESEKADRLDRSVKSESEAPSSQAPSECGADGH